jgi:uroporphyrinogen-III synthase
MDLKGIHVLITRPAGQSAAMAAMVEQRGGIALIAPMIRVLPAEKWAECDRHIAHLRDFNGVVFSSANGAAMFLRRMYELHVALQTLADVPLFAVGEKTAHALEHAGLAPTHVPETFSGADLASVFKHMNLHRQRFLLPRGDLGREEIAEELRRAGAEAVPVVVYKTVGPDDGAVATVRSALMQGALDVATFASPSAVEHFAALLQTELLEHFRSRTIVAVIGGTTAAAARRLGLPVHVIASRATAEGLVEALAAWEPIAKEGAGEQ